MDEFKHFLNQNTDHFNQKTALRKWVDLTDITVKMRCIVKIKYWEEFIITYIKYPDPYIKFPDKFSWINYCFDNILKRPIILFYRPYYNKFDKKILWFCYKDDKCYLVCTKGDETAENVLKLEPLNKKTNFLKCFRQFYEYCG